MILRNICYLESKWLWAFLGAVCIQLNFSVATGDGFEMLFDGRSLTGWETPDASYWSVEDGAIVGRISREHPCTLNQYLVWKGGELADFELVLKSRLNGEGGINNGFQFRSRLLPDHDVCGYQVDNNLQTPWLVRLYDEYGRHTLALRGERATFDSNGLRVASKIEQADGDPWFRLENWHEYHLTCVGPNISLRVDGQLAAEVQDNDRRRQDRQGIFALQLHSGPPTVVQFKDIRLKILKPAETKRRSVASRKEKQRTALFKKALAWWPLDTGGHGAKPTLRHIPGWEQFELNVAAEGPDSRPGAKCILLEGAYLEAGPDLQAGTDRLTVFLRARDPRGQWSSALFSKNGGRERVHFSLFGADFPETPGPQIAFEVQTEQGPVRVNFPVGKINPTGWHDLVGRYDGESVALFCDGKIMASKPCRGSLLTSANPLLIGAESDGQKVGRHFHGELEEAAMWATALSDKDIAVISKWR